MHLRFDIQEGAETYDACEVQLRSTKKLLAATSGPHDVPGA